MTVAVRLNDAAITALAESPNGLVVQDLLRRGRRVQNRARELCPVDQGMLRSSITTELVITSVGPVVRVGTNVHYARYVHEGTGIYGPRGMPIVPVRASILRWPARGVSGVRRSNVPGRGLVTSRSLAGQGFVFAKSVRGTPGRPFLRDALPAAA